MVECSIAILDRQKISAGLEQVPLNGIPSSHFEYHLKILV